MPILGSIKAMEFNSFKEFYPFYLSQHKNLNCIRLHFLGTFCVLIILFYVMFTLDFKALWTLPFIGYSFAWIGHFVFEKNKPATFKFPFYSLVGDFNMFFDILSGKIKIT